MCVWRREARIDHSTVKYSLSLEPLKGLQCKSGISNVPLFFADSKNVRFSRFLSFLDKINQSVRVFSELRSQRIAEASRERLSWI